MPAELLFLGAEADALHVLLDDQSGDALGAFLAGADHGHVNLVLAAAGDEGLRPRDDIMVAVQHRLGLERGGVRARGRLGQAIAADPLHRDHRREIFMLELVGAEAVDHPGGHVVDRDEGAGRRAAVGHRFHDQRRLEPAEADAAAFLRDVDGAEAQLGGLADGVAGEDVLLVPLGGKRRDRVGGELGRHFLDLELVVGEVELRHRGRPLALPWPPAPVAQLHLL